MRILQVVTYISPDGAYGGPVRVAINQAKALRKMGHTVVILAAAGGFNEVPPNEYDGVPVKLFPARRVLPKTGFAGLTSPRLLLWLAHSVKSADVVHVHLARDLVTLPAAALSVLAKKPLVVQTHGMIDHTDNVLANPLDKLLTRPILRRARSVLHLTATERDALIAVAGKTLKFRHLPNGVVVPPNRAIEQKSGPQAVPEVIYLARLHARKRPLFVLGAASELQTRWPCARFVLVGPDEGEGRKISQAIQQTTHSGYATWVGALPPRETSERMLNSSIFVLPSVNEPFGMSVIEAMALGIPVVVTNSCGLAPTVQQYNAGIVCGPSQSEFTAAVEMLLGNETKRIEMGARGRVVVQEQFSLDAVITNLVGIYNEAAKKSEGSRDH